MTVTLAGVKLEQNDRHTYRKGDTDYVSLGFTVRELIIIVSSILSNKERRTRHKLGLVHVSSTLP